MPLRLQATPRVGGGSAFFVRPHDTLMISTKSSWEVIVILAFVCLAATVDWFLVPQIESDGHGLFVAVLIGSSFAAVGAWVFLVVCFHGVRLFKKLFSK